MGQVSQDTVARSHLALVITMPVTNNCYESDR